MTVARSQVPIVIPAYKPGAALESLVKGLLGGGTAPIIVIDDGSGPAFGAIFDRVAASDGVQVIRHAVNLGKGAALKAGINHALVQFPSCAGIVTADADGQHAPEDIARVAEALRLNPNAMILGVREFGPATPLRSRIGNQVTRRLMRYTLGQRLADSQTGLRGIPAAMLPHFMRLSSSGYEFELDMLIACQHHACPIEELPIQTIYIDGNKSSHFRPIADSMRIYFVLFRFTLLALLTAAIDNAVFIPLFAATGSVAQSQACGRLVAMIFNYLGARSPVFHSRQHHRVVFPKYVSLVVISGLLSYEMIQFIHLHAGLSPITSKLIAEGLLFFVNFAVQRDFVFKRRNGKRKAQMSLHGLPVSPDSELFRASRGEARSLGR